MEIVRTARQFIGRGAVAAAAIALAASACATLPQQSQDLYSGFTPLEARLYEPMGGVVHFAVSKPAYAAVFEVAPGGGMRMLFPSTTHQAQRRIASGYSFAPLRYGSTRDHLAFASGWSRDLRPTYLVLIASERPLRVDRMVNSPWALRSELGFATFYSASAGVHTIERLAERIVPNANSSDWAYDTYIVWPTLDAPVPRAVPIVCADGSVRMVRGTRVPLDCLQPPTPPDSVNPPTGDSAAAAPRTRGRPPRAEPERDPTTITRGTDSDRSRGRDAERGGRTESERVARPTRPDAREARRGGGSGVAARSGRPSSGDSERAAGRGARAGGTQSATPAARGSGARDGGTRAESQAPAARERAPASRPQNDRPREARPPSAEQSGDRASQ